MSQRNNNPAAPEALTRDEIALELARLDSLDNAKSDADYDRIDALVDFAMAKGWL